MKKSDDEIKTQDRTMTLQTKDLLKRKIYEYKELACRLQLYVMFFKSLFPYGKDNVSSTDALFSKLVSIVNMPIPKDDDFFASNLKKTLDKSFKDLRYSSKNSCSYDNIIDNLYTCTKKYFDYKRANTDFKVSFAEYMSYYFDSYVKDTCDFFTLLTLNKVTIDTQYSIINF
ncbi:uncharacterized protein LOC126901537 [Daktulosphaira vitifoliae]|uniref:uncharacterized protein LOC126901537 n=1 Tax=Daktulosphaira vitifoliae TaxID=58002 RepID=UPI0021AA93B3|nr:uncharacterized protein LOC126901537 [Daktulosphaira vitifoliae]